MKKISSSRIQSFQKTVYDYYRNSGRHALPWRKKITPYAIVISECMLQQTQVDRVIPFFKQWMKFFPSWKKLAHASTRDVVQAWKGLGYNNRALRLQKLARVILNEYHGKFPRERSMLESLPGIGPYTAGAIRIFAYQQPDVCIETNIRRVFLHHFFSRSHEKIDDRDILPLIAQTIDIHDPRVWYFALMDYGSFLGRTIRNPNHKSKHYQKQKPFKGSDRFVRGKVLEFVLQQPKTTLSAVQKYLPSELPKSQIEKVVQSLEKDGFLHYRSRKIILVS